MTIEERNALAEQYIPFAHKLTNSFLRYNVNIKGRGRDFRQVACLALVESASRFDETKGVKFTTYSRKLVLWRLRQYRPRTNVVYAPLQERGTSVERIIKSRLAGKDTQDIEGIEICEAFKEDQSERIKLMHEAFERLSKLEKVVLRARFVRGASLDRIGKRLKFSCAYIGFVERDALIFLKRAIEAKERKGSECRTTHTTTY